MMQRLKKRAEFLAVSRGTRAGRRAFSLQCGAGPTTEAGQPRVGFTVTKKVGTATERNRVRRRLREAVRALSAEALAKGLAEGMDYVVVGRREALGEPFQAIVSDLQSALRQLKRQTGARAASRSGADAASAAGAAGPPDPGSEPGPQAGSVKTSAERPNPSGDT
jgi:ribonuclease P protein component